MVGHHRSIFTRDLLEYGSTPELLACPAEVNALSQRQDKQVAGHLFILHIAWSRDLYDLKTEPTPRFQELSCLPLCLTSAAPGRKEHLLP
jgi:hypothetical protein